MPPVSEFAPPVTRPIRNCQGKLELSQLSHRFRRRANFTPLFQRLSGSFPNHPSLAISPFSRQQQIHRTGIDPSPANPRIRNYAAIANSRPQVRRAQVFLTPHSSSLLFTLSSFLRALRRLRPGGRACGPPLCGGIPPATPPSKITPRHRRTSLPPLSPNHQPQSPAGPAALNALRGSKKRCSPRPPWIKRC